MGDALKPCPFCGREAEKRYYAMTPNIGCPACEYSIDGESERAIGETAEMGKLIAAWNRRATPPEVTALVEALRSINAVSKYIIGAERIDGEIVDDIAETARAALAKWESANA